MERRRLPEDEAATPVLSSDASRSSSATDLYGNPYLLDTLSVSIEELKRLQIDAQIDPGKPVKEPQTVMFRKWPSCKIVPPIIDERLEYCMVLLHDKGHKEESLRDLARRLQQTLKGCVYILLRAPFNANGGYSWSGPDQGQNSDRDYFRSSAYILESIVLKCLVQKCYFRPRNIVLLGHGEGGFVALKAASLWSDVELGGVIAVENLPEAGQLSLSQKSKTPVLIVRRKVEHDTLRDLEWLRKVFSFVDSRDRPDGDEGPPTGSDERNGSDNGLKPYMDFLIHRLKRDEWNKQDILSFDGGGIRGYGTLLILKKVMEAVADEEKRQDSSVESSFSPCPFRPIKSTAEETSEAVADQCENYPSKSAKFLPCHYFTYGAGTSTGGLISIMLFRLRMSVDECIQEYKTLGGEVFGRPRPPVINKIMPKFNEKYLEECIKDVCRRYGEPVKLKDLNYTTANAAVDDRFRCMTLAISHRGDTRRLYPFRTYWTPGPRTALSRSATAVQKIRGYGDPSQLAIWEVARATSAAPGYFAPIAITGGDGKTTHVFKDGGFGYNNPTLEMYDDIVHKYGEENIGLVVSISTGETELKLGSARNHVRDTISNLKTAIKLPTMTGPVHSRMESLSKNNKLFKYCRFDGGKELGKLALDEWETHKFTGVTKRNSDRGNKTLEKIEKATSQFLEGDTITEEIKDLAKLLVEKRRLRARDRSEWDRFASCSYYTCEPRWPLCKTTRCKTANEFREHIGKEHQEVTLEEHVVEALGTCRRSGWVYPPREKTAPGAA